MPILTNLNPVTAYTASVVTDGTILTNGLGTQLTSLQLTSSFANTASFAVTSSISVISQFDISSSYASASSTASSLIQNGLIPNQFRVSGDLADVYVFNTQSALFVSTSGSSAVVGMGNGICFADNGFQVAGGVGFEDIRQTASVAVWQVGTLSLSSSNVAVTELNTLHGISQSLSLQSQIDGKQPTLLTASVSPSTPGSIAGWVNVTVQGTLFWIPLYK